MTQPQSSRNARTAIRLLVIAGVMFGFGFALVPLYDVFCDITGLNGRVELTQAAPAASVDATREVTVEFVANRNQNLPWRFEPVQDRIVVHPGATRTVIFVAENLQDVAVTGRAVPSVTPGEASRHLHKVECFCFTEQKLEPRERKEMPVTFYLDPALPASVDTVTLAYTFFDAKA